MNCERIRLGIASDEPEERDAFESHAAGCVACAAFNAADRALLAEVAAWKHRTPAPPPELEARIARMLAQRARPLRATHRKGLWLAAAAAFLLAVSAAVLYRGTSHSTRTEGIDLAIRRADEAERDYARAIARLESESRGILARAADPALDAQSAATLVALRDRLAHLDSVIADAHGFLDENPGNSEGHAVLRSAYKEKTDVLRHVLALQAGDHS